MASDPLDIIMAQVLAAIPDEGIIAEPQPEPVTPEPRLFQRTGWRDRYRDPWPRPDCAVWNRRFTLLHAKLDDGGCGMLIGGRGTGKTRMAAEACRDIAPTRCRYTTAMRFFLRVRASYRRDSVESEAQAIDDLAGAELLVIDELQERGESEWEDRLLTHLMDERYARKKPTILIANLKPDQIASHLGPSVTDRLRETGGVIRVEGERYRTKAASSEHQTRLNHE